MYVTFLTRKQYDALIDRYPAFMAEDWSKHFTTKWNLAGVTVTTTHEGWYHALNTNLSNVTPKFNDPDRDMSKWDANWPPFQF